MEELKYLKNRFEFHSNMVKRYLVLAQQRNYKSKNALPATE